MVGQIIKKVFPLLIIYIGNCRLMTKDGVIDSCLSRFVRTTLASTSTVEPCFSPTLLRMFVCNYSQAIRNIILTCVLKSGSWVKKLYYEYDIDLNKNS